MKNKIQIDFTDGIPLAGKIPISEKDSEGKELFIGDTIVSGSGEKSVIGYRYGDVSLIPPQGMHTVTVKDYSGYKKVNEITCIMGKYLIIGYDNEPFFKVNSDELSKIEITNTIPQ